MTTLLQRRKTKVLLNKQNCNHQPANLHKIFQTNTRTRAHNRAYATGPSRRTTITIPYRMVQINGQPTSTDHSGAGIQNPIQEESNINNASGALQKEGDQRSSNTIDRRSRALLTKKAIEKLKSNPLGFSSQLFTILKKTGA
ncbi:hypothetical protein BB560_001809 [Smittium megazygosporum]|uniref:Uncharacterized protein n=1 Tax=Smittium megazygosporum TaxID=133381 RepID=A0A2T9ZGJ0_9FUNG|nr:hypothetical protein BB560_001809 [Smittium megazygosporum]